MTLRQQIFQKARRVVLKVGTTLLTDDGQQINARQIKALVEQIAALTAKGKEIILVSSGAIGAGMARRRLKVRPRALEELQATAAIGQIQLMKLYDTFFEAHQMGVSQVLLTRADFSDRKRYLNARKTLEKLLEWKFIPVINENDTVAVDEIKVGDNDQLSALVAHAVDADLLVLLSNVDGLYPHGRIGGGASPIDLVEVITPELARWAKPTRNQTSTGGMVTKLEAAKMAVSAGIPCVLANGLTSRVLLRLFDGEEIGTLFMTQRRTSMKSKHRWLAFTSRPKGVLVVDQGARRALVERKKSLLASGVTALEGKFKKGDLVRIIDSQKNEFARGIVGFSFEELAKIKGLKSDQIQKMIGFRTRPEVIHRDQLVIL